MGENGVYFVKNCVENAIPNFVGLGCIPIFFHGPR